MRVVNAFQYNYLWGFDAHFNWEYIQYLTTTWALPDPEALWSAAHPPLFYYVSAAILRAAGPPSAETGVVIIRLIGTLAALATVGLAYAVVRRIAPESPRRALIAGGLLLFLPVHIYMSAMVTEEVIVTLFISLAISALGVSHSDAGGSLGPGRVLAIGALCGLAFLTKLSGALVAAAACGTILFEGWRRSSLRWAGWRLALVVTAVVVIGGWFYLRSLVLYGYLYPHGLEIHQVMFTMPPGVRHVSDYFYLPFAIWTDPQVMNHDLRRSIWGSTYVTLYFEGHRAFLPHSVPIVDRLGGVLLALGLVPTTAFVVGAVRGARRVFTQRSVTDFAFLLLIALTLGGYVLFTWRNPFFAVCKASFLLGLSVPFAFYASEILDEWTGRGSRTAVAVTSALALGVLLVAVTFTQSRLFWNMDHMPRPGMVWATYDPVTGELRYE